MRWLAKKMKGFTLIELLVTVAIGSILAIIAINVFTSNIRQGRRIDGINTLLSVSLAEERYRSNNTTYGTLAQVWNGVTASPQGYYTLSITGNSATAYTISATAVGDQANDSVNATACTPLVLSVSNGTVTKSPAACWPT